MKYDILNNVRERMQDELCANTARKYYSSLVKLFGPLQFSEVSEIKKEYIEQTIASRFKTKNEFSSAKNGLKYFKQCYPELQLPEEDFFKECSIHKRNRSKKPKKNLSLKETRQKIKAVEDEKLRLAYELAMASGLRVSELSALRKNDLKFTEDGGLHVDVTAGKGGANGTVECIRDAEMIHELQQYTEKLGPDEKLFFSEAYMRKTADNAGFECHDLRRIFSQRKRRELMKSMSAYEANVEVQKSLRHARFSTTKRYLFNRKLIFDDFEEEEG